MKKFISKDIINGIYKLVDIFSTDIQDFQSAVSNNSDVSANTNARHTQNTDTGTTAHEFYIDTNGDNVPVKSHIQNTNNPHNVTAGQIGALTSESDPIYTSEKPNLWKKDEDITLYSGDEATALQRKIASPSSLLDGFDYDTLNSMWSWAGSPFFIPTQSSDNSVGTYGLQYPSVLHMVLKNSNSRAFIYISGSPNSGKVQGTFAFATMALGSSIGIRYDDGTDNNYAEAGIEVTGATVFKIVLRERNGGGSVNTVYGNEISLPMPVIVKLVAGGTPWSSWTPRAWFTMPYNIPLMAQFLSAQGSTTHAWTPQRYGIYFRPPFGAGAAFLACDEIVIV